MTTNYDTTAINSFFIGEDGLSFNTDNFTNSLFSKDSLAGALGAGVCGGMGAVNLQDTNNIALNSNTFNTGGIKAFNELTGGLVQNGVSLAMGGNATFNLANAYGVGMLEFSFGKDGIKSRIGMGGTNISVQNLKAAASGYKEASKVIDWKYGDTETSSTLNSTNMLGYTNSEMNQQLAKDIWSEELEIEYADTGKSYGNYTVGDNKIILSENLLGGGKEGSAKLASVMSHEGTHYNGNRIEGIANIIAADTYSQLNQNFKLQADTSFSLEMLAGIINADNWTENTGDVDYWKLIKQENGKYGLQYDGVHSLYDSKKNLIIRNEMDEFDDNGNNLGAWAKEERDYTSFNSYAASLGMLLGTYTNYMDNEDAYENNWSMVGNNELRQTTIDLLNEQFKDSSFTLLNGKNGIIDTNRFLMTKIGIETGKGVYSFKNSRSEELYQAVNIFNEYNEVVGIAINYTNFTDNHINLFSIENMIPEGKRLKAGTIKFEAGNVEIYGLGSTIPDPTKMGKDHPAIDDGTYAYSYALHNPLGDNPYLAIRLYDSTPISWNEVIGQKGQVEVSNFPYSTGEWGKRQQSFPAYYYENDIKKKTLTNLINGHYSNFYPFTKSNNGYVGGSLGCSIWHPYTFSQLTSTWEVKEKVLYGYYIIDRTLFGDGTGGQNDWTKW